MLTYIKLETFSLCKDREGKSVVTALNAMICFAYGTKVFFPLLVFYTVAFMAFELFCTECCSYEYVDGLGDVIQGIVRSLVVQPAKHEQHCRTLAFGNFTFSDNEASSPICM